MTRSNMYKQVEKLLEENPVFRDSDRRLVWAVWKKYGRISPDDSITAVNFFAAPSSETITRARRKVQENRIDLRPSKEVEKLRKHLADMNGNFIFFNETQL